MVRLFQLAALVMVAVVLAGTQCVELCSLLAEDRQLKVAQADEHGMPCHQHPRKHQQEQPPVGNEECTHHELIAEKLAKAFLLDDLQTMPLEAADSEADLVPIFCASALKLADRPVPRVSPLTLTTILRI